MATSREKGKKATKKSRDGDTNPRELGESIDSLSEVDVSMRLEAMDTFGKWLVWVRVIGFNLKDENANSRI